jgi:hypothetical protein
MRPSTYFHALLHGYSDSILIIKTVRFIGHFITQLMTTLYRSLSHTVFSVLLGSGFQQWTFFCSQTRVLTAWRPSHTKLLLLKLTTTYSESESKTKLWLHTSCFGHCFWPSSGNTYRVALNFLLFPLHWLMLTIGEGYIALWSVGF